ncbi:hypothetical protein RND81_13G160400 [Saponaria officinalis]|uniref:CID domain-containing protein n=1 Tax=Saponaria officinalis TaxID=3572 RepID=A0AAW1H6G5_SAPOF
MGSTFNPQILMEKLSKLNNSQQSIETLSHWCIFHMNKAKLVVESWEKQFQCAPRRQKLTFLYLANDILQNSRRKGAEFVTEFWRVLPGALHEVIRNGDDAGKNAARRLISIWDERKVFGTRGHILKEEFLGKQPGNSDRSRALINLKFRQSTGNVFDKIVSDYEMLCGGELDEDALLSRCTTTTSTLEKIVTDFGSGVNSGNVDEELQKQHASLRECIEQLTALESSRAALVSHLKIALQEQESKLDKVRSQLQAAQLQSDQATHISQQLFNSDNMLPNEQGSSVPPSCPPKETQATPVVYCKQASLSDDKSIFPDDNSRKAAAAAVAAKLTASTASAEMLTLALTSLVSGVPFGNNSSAVQESRDDHQLVKKPKLENASSPSPSSSPQPPLTPMMAPYPMTPPFIQTNGATSNVAYSYGAPPPNLPGYPSVGPSMTGMSPYALPLNPSQNHQVPEGGYCSSSVPMAPMSHLRTS